MDEIKPFFQDNYATLAFSSSDYFIPYLTVTLKSIVDNSDEHTNYDIIIFSKDASEANKKYVIDFISRKNISVRFVNVKEYFKNLKLYTAAHITIETYFRLVIPLFLKNFDRVLFLDADLIITDDINKLYSMDIKGYPIAATEECLFSAHIRLYGKEAIDYVHKKLGLSDLDTYFQAGVMLFDVKKFSEFNYSTKLMEMVTNFNYNILDQDALNELFNNNYYRFGNEWNWPPMQKHMKELKYIEKMSPNIRAKYLAVTDPKIIHYADKNKPWLDPNEDMAVTWWDYARTTPYYELILYRMNENLYAKKGEYEEYIAYTIRYQENKSNYLKYRILSKITFGKRRARHKRKKQEARYELQKANEIARKFAIKLGK
ncbi:glycosyltransferase family 8 protein [Saezia sanguinis]|uniref:glycosyltransferase family 8 protein n=1 Tax=Saezia sanguinis TaxID=1965230 RepID=UPI003049AFF7